MLKESPAAMQEALFYVCRQFDNCYFQNDTNTTFKLLFIIYNIYIIYNK
jgi:hypothetical protein